MDANGKDGMEPQGLHAIRARLYISGSKEEETSSEGDDQKMWRHPESCRVMGREVLSWQHVNNACEFFKPYDKFVHRRRGSG